jgi:nucleotide-binding universal stress UspA family protein
MIALDDSADAWRAVELAGERFGRTAGATVILLHVLPDLPPRFWDIGHFLSPAERKSQARLVEEWEKSQEKKWTAVVRRAKEFLVRSGISASAVKRKFVPGIGDPATEIVSEARKAGCTTIVIGRGGGEKGSSSSLGDNTDKVIRLARDLDVLVAGSARRRTQTR